MGAALSIAGARDFSVADAACTGTVEVVNCAYAFPDNRIDWSANPTRGTRAFNPEWTWQLNRMDFWTQMASAYEATKDEKYVRAFVTQLEDWLDQTGGGIPPEKNWGGRGSKFRTIEEGLRLSDSWRVAWRAFSKSPEFPEALRQRFIASARAHANPLMRPPSSAGNWLLIETNGAYAFAALFPHFPECAEIRQTMARRMADAIREQVLPDGLQYELSPDYHSVSIGCASMILETARETGFEHELPTDFAAILLRMGESTLALTTPKLSQPRFNDCYTMFASEMLRQLARLFPERQDFLWAVSCREQGREPQGKTASRFLPWSGFAAMRTGWDAEALYVCFDVGPLGMAHYHQDKLSFTLWKGDEELVFEDGGGHYEDSDERIYAQSGYDHNTLLVDGLAQFRREPLCMTGPIDAKWDSNANRDSACGVYDQGFGTNELKLAVHRREIVLDKVLGTVTVSDIVRSADGKVHDYDLLFQLDTTNVAKSADGQTLTADYGQGRKWKLKLEVSGADSIDVVSGRLKPSLAGWYIGRNDTANHPATTVFVRRRQALENTFVTRLTPIR